MPTPIKHERKSPGRVNECSCKVQTQRGQTLQTGAGNHLLLRKPPLDTTRALMETWPCFSNLSLLPLCISHADGKIAFCIFLRSEFCDENIEFWSACEEFKKIKSRKEMASKANRIYEEFIKSEAPKEVNLDFHTKNAIAQSLHKPTATSFLVAQRKIYNLMENNSYPRFISSDLYKELYAAAAREDMDVKS
uniref:Regulator of G protein signaling 2 n=1 Tax=Neolamprologus brichardi TaxID=32507 RepID=A0A3Q4I1J4_NEOBR